MPRVCILTDSTAQFPREEFPGRERVFIAAHALRQFTRPEPVASFLGGSARRLAPPSPQEFQRLYHSLSRQYDLILVLALSSLLSPLAAHAATAAARFHDHASVEVLDTRTTSIGLGWLVEQAAAAAENGVAPPAIIKQVRTALPQVFFLFFVPQLAPLVAVNQLDAAQAVVGGILELLPIFMLEEGRMVPIEKARSPRAVLEYFSEFLDEFESPREIALVYGSGQTMLNLKFLRQHIQDTHPRAGFIEQVFSPPVEVMLGAQSVGMAVLQKG